MYKKALKTTARDMDILLQKWLDEHKQKQYSNEKFEIQDFMDVMLPIIDEVAGEYPLYDGDTIIKSTCLGMLLGGIDGAAVSLTWTISLLLNHPHIFKRAQQELDMHVGRQRQVKDSDIEKLVYLQSVIKESL
ncbi:cytochrome P450, partial [Acinetobacter baumannii]